MNLFALPCFKRYPVITPPLKASRLNKRRGEGEFIRGSAVFISNLKMKIRKRLDSLVPLVCIENVTSQ